MKSASVRAGANNNKLLTATIKPTNNNLIDIDDSSSSSSSSLTEKFQRKGKSPLVWLKNHFSKTVFFKRKRNS